jgi:MFS family permease
VVPLYYELVRGVGATEAGLLLTLQALGGALTMPYAGRLTDRFGARRLIPIGVGLMLIGTFPFTQVGSTTPFLLLMAAQLVRGFGLGFTMLPSNAAALTSVPHDQIRGASTMLSIIQRLGASLGAVFSAVWLERQLRAAVPAGHGSALSALSALPAASRAHLSGPLATAFAHTFWLSFALTAVTVAPVLLLKPGRIAVHEVDVPATEGVLP